MKLVEITCSIRQQNVLLNPHNLLFDRLLCRAVLGSQEKRDNSEGISHIRSAADIHSLLHYPHLQLELYTSYNCEPTLTQHRPLSTGFVFSVVHSLGFGKFTMA